MLYEYIPHKNLKQTAGLLIIFISAAVGCFMFPAIFPDMTMRWLFQLSGALLLVAVIFVYTRHIGKTFIYRIIEDDEGGLALTVTEVTGGGRSRITVCRFSLENIEEAHSLELSEGEKKRALNARAKKERRKTFNYCPDVSTPRVAYLYVRESGEPLFIKLATDDTLFSYFTSDVQDSMG